MLFGDLSGVLSRNDVSETFLSIFLVFLFCKKRPCIQTALEAIYLPETHFESKLNFDALQTPCNMFVQFTLCVVVTYERIVMVDTVLCIVATWSLPQLTVLPKIPTTGVFVVIFQTFLDNFSVEAR